MSKQEFTYDPKKLDLIDQNIMFNNPGLKPTNPGFLGKSFDLDELVEYDWKGNLLAGKS